MEKMDLKNTKKQLAIMFAVIVFCVSFFLELSYFTIRYTNLSFYEKREFNLITEQLSEQFRNNPMVFNIFLTEGLRFRPPKEDYDRQPERALRFLNFIVLDSSWNIIAQNLNQNISLSNRYIYSLTYNNLEKISDSVLIKKVDISYFWWDIKDIIFIKELSYSLEDYFWDVFFFFLVTVCFSIVFYYIGIFFVDKNLKPVEEALADMNDFIHNANHELRTPISVISSNLQLMKATKSYEVDLVSDSLNEIKRMDNLILELSNFSDIQSISESIELDIQKEIQDIINEYQKEIDAKKINLTFTTIKNFSTKANTEYFYIMFSNLLRNAIKYNFESWSIHINLDKSKISISNTGLPIESSDLPHIFDRFFKWEKARNTQWFWIWLSLVKKICDIYKWKILVKSQSQKTIFEIVFK